MLALPRPFHGSAGRTSRMLPNKHKRTIYHVRKNNKVSFLEGESFLWRLPDQSFPELYNSSIFQTRFKGTNQYL